MQSKKWVINPPERTLKKQQLELVRNSLSQLNPGGDDHQSTKKNNVTKLVKNSRKWLDHGEENHQANTLRNRATPVETNLKLVRT